MKWITACHKELDKEYKFSKRRMVMERQFNAGKSVLDRKSIFENMSFEVVSKGGNSKTEKLDVGQHVKLNVTQTGKLSNSANSCVWYGKIEGFETEVLKGGQNIIKDQKPLIAIERHAFNYKLLGKTKKESHLYLQELGYQMLFKLTRDCIYGIPNIHYKT